MDIPAYYRSLTAELESVKDRVRNFIKGNHWITDGEWKESVLRSMIAQRLPDSVKIGHGFIITPNGPSTQCDILLYRADCPVLFREGDLVFVSPDAALAVIEVKSRATSVILAKAAQKLAAIGRKLGRQAEHCCLGFFAYECDNLSHDTILDKLEKLCPHRSQTIDLVSVGCSTFVRYWEFPPSGGDDHYETWHSYYLKDMSAGYFIANILDAVSPDSISQFGSLWFPDAENVKDRNVTGKRCHKTALDNGDPTAAVV